MAKGTRSIGKSDDSVSTGSGGVNLSSSSNLADQTRLKNEELMRSVAARLKNMDGRKDMPSNVPVKPLCDPKFDAFWNVSASPILEHGGTVKYSGSGIDGAFE